MKLRLFFPVIISSLALPAISRAAEEGVSPAPYKLTEILGLPLTNSILTSWIISLVIILVVRRMVGKPTLVPSRGQAMVEGIVNGVKDLIEPIVGKHLVRPTFWLLSGLFLFILINNWSGLLPGVGAYGLYDESGDLKYWQRPGNADMNMTLALAIIVQLAWFYYVFKYAGLKALLYDWFGNKADPKEMPVFIYVALFPIFFAVGIIEVISWAFRTVSLSFRLYGNVFGGENLLTNMTDLVAWVVPVPFYFLEVLIGFVQALVFALLAAVYIGLICNHEGEGEHH
ncbi:MAG: F0F1 ATP synthase subunit A [Opitutales bacterium]